MSTFTTGILAGEMMARQTTVTNLTNIWQPIGAIGGAVILGIVLPMIKGCQERSQLSQQNQVEPAVNLADASPEVASTKR